ncbi:MAG TPA: hypothetical protein VFE45_16680 [Coriobacteriia bacterium]|nr:hypothetical protein [Coriobacteriia bacterium]
MPPEDLHSSINDLVALYRAGTIVVTPDEASPWVILKCSRASFYRAMSKGEVPGVLTLGRTRRLQLGTLLEWLGALPE